MNKFTRSITVFGGEFYNVEVRLGACQYYSNKISEQMLSDAGVDIKNDHLNLSQVLNLVKKRKDLVVSFYGVKNSDQLHIFSDFFNLDGAFSDVFSFFDDLNSVLLMCEKLETSISIDLIKHGKKLFHFIVSIKNGIKVEHSLWQPNYKIMCGLISGLPSASDIECSLDFILQNSLKSDNQMHKFLEQNALFKDDYIL